ncbi:MAG: hypothetical protein OEZ06_26285 [Myxococcales bacterium]|nr:hypothetical protein [Myxococcales bacterium]
MAGRATRISAGSRSLLVASAVRFALLAAVFALSVTPTHATTIARTDLAALARDADAVIDAVVERTGTQMAYNASTFPWSLAQLRVLRWLAGGEGDRVWVRDPGAVWSNGGRPLSGSAVYSPGEEVVVFLGKDVGPYYRTHQLGAGKLVVRRDGEQAVVEQDLQDVSVLVARQAPALAEPPFDAIVPGQRRVVGPLLDVLQALQTLLGTGR